jgi:hypothetical protein
MFSEVRYHLGSSVSYAFWDLISVGFECFICLWGLISFGFWLAGKRGQQNSEEIRGRTAKQ